MIAGWLAEDILKTVVLFEKRNPTGGYDAHGSGVLVLHDNVFFVATCKHIVQSQNGVGHAGLQASINKADGTVSRKDLDALIPTLGIGWCFHQNVMVDLAVLPITLDPAMEDLKLVGPDLLETFDDTPLGDEIFFLGYPLGLGIADVARLSPLVRAGIVALKKNDKTFLIDANVYPGSSGSPVFYKPVVGMVQANRQLALGGGRATKLLGIVSSYVPYREVAISQQTQRPRIIFEENSGLGNVMSSTLLKEIFANAAVQAFIQRVKPPAQPAAAPAAGQP